MLQLKGTSTPPFARRPSAEQPLTQMQQGERTVSVQKDEIMQTARSHWQGGGNNGGAALPGPHAVASS